MSSPANTSNRSKKASSSQKSRKFMNVTVHFLDDSNYTFQLQGKSLGQVLFEKVCKHINLFEVDYFGLEYEDEKNSKCWLEALKPLCTQIATSFPTMYFCVKFYTPDPAQLEDEFTRYLFGLQIRKDLSSGHLQCNDNTAAVLISYIVQADLGDFDSDRCPSSYLSGSSFLPLQDADLEKKIMDNYKKLVGQSPAKADLNLLETARRCELYGIKMTPAKDHEGVPLNLAVAHMGVIVFQNFTKINTFSWAKIRKLSFKRKKFLIKLHPEGCGLYRDTVEFFFEGRNECKNYWKKCIENHTFFRCNDAKQGMRQKPKIFSRGSSFRYSGRTQKQVSEFVRDNCFKRQPFQRSTSLRSPSSPSRSIGSDAASSSSPRPLLPVTSLSCGSISDFPPRGASEPGTPRCSATTPDTPLSAGPLSSPEANPEQSGGGDFFGQDDTTSHDSYDILEREGAASATNASNGPAASATNPNDAPADDDGKSAANPEEEEDDDPKRKSRRHRVRVFANHIHVGQTSPTLYARANRHRTAEMTRKAYPRTVDFVYVHQLPAVGSFSYRDDSVELHSPGRIRLEALCRRIRSVDDGGKVRSKSQPMLPVGVDLLGDLLPSGGAVHKRSSSDFVAAQPQTESKFHDPSDLNMDIGTMSDVPTQQGDGSAASGSLCPQHRPHQTVFPDFNTDIVTMSDVSTRQGDGSGILCPQHRPHQTVFPAPRDFDTDIGAMSDLLSGGQFASGSVCPHHHLVYVDVVGEHEYVDRSTHYSYNTYKFSHIGRPPDLPLKKVSRPEMPRSQKGFDESS